VGEYETPRAKIGVLDADVCHVPASSSMRKILAANSARLLNISLRSATLGTRFFFIFFLAKYLDPALVGYYGIFTATVGYALYFVGLDFYTYVTREIIRVPAGQRGRLLKGQVALSALLYLVLLPLAVWLLPQTGWPAHLVWWFFPILFLEHLNQEMSRLLIALSEQLTSSVILFIRQGSWAVAIIAIMSFDSNTRNLDVVMAVWAIAGVAAASMGIWKLIKLKTEGWAQPVDWAWIRKGVAVSSAFLLATLALRGLQTFDRYWLEALGSIEMVGAYVLLLGVASTLMVFLDAAVFAFAYPELIVHHHHGEHLQARRKVNRLFTQTVIFSVAFGLVSWILLPYFLTWIHNPTYQKAASWYPWLLSAATINALGMVPHYALYARGVDKPIIHSHLAALLVFALVTWLFSHVYGAFSVPIGLNFAFLSIFLWKAVVYLTLIGKDAKSMQIHV
jgi:O-antigen/teichoic acid export membrane protein